MNERIIIYVCLTAIAIALIMFGEGAAVLFIAGLAILLL